MVGKSKGMNDYYTEWTWMPDDEVWLLGSMDNGIGVYESNDDCDDGSWTYNLVIDGSVVVLSEYKFDCSTDAKAAAEIDYNKRKNESDT